MKKELEILDVVVALQDRPQERIRKGSLGTIVEIFDGGRFLVEFADLNGVPYAMPILSGDQMLKIYQEPVEAA
ncbi:MAG: DUF4926 domain-containing protein [Cytophagales bacterium]|nr:MAG: DUF4926 domain-containing protein [Cytophagales bacterium]